jgi:hypothetical protein
MIKFEVVCFVMSFVYRIIDIFKFYVDLFLCSYKYKCVGYINLESYNCMLLDI